jgi:hypothetical protein
MKTQKNIKTFLMITMLVTLLSCNGFTQENRTPAIVKTFDLNQPGTLNAKSSGGGVTANNQNGDVHLSSSGGGITLDDAQCSAYAHSSGWWRNSCLYAFQRWKCNCTV